MQLKKVHWFYAGTAAIALHAAVFIGLNRNPKQAGDVSPAAGPVAATRNSSGGLVGTAPDDVEIEMLESIRETNPHEVIEPTSETAEVAEATSEVNVAMSAPLAAPVEAEAVMEVKALKPAETLDAKEPTSKAEKPREPKTLDVNEIVEPERNPRPREKKKTNENKGKDKRVVRAQRRGNSERQGGAGSGGGGGKSQASAGAIAGYASRVRSRILSRSPANAGHRGTTVVSFGVTTSGGLSYARVSRSSGNKALDQRALASVRGASPFPQPPAGARASQLRFSVPFHFR